jgi:DNA-binding MarR family transcriptional regulator
MAKTKKLSTRDADRLLKTLLVLSRTVDHILETRAVDQAANEPLSPSKVQVLRLLGEQGTQTASQVARFLGVSKPAVTQIIDSMVDGTLVTRSTAAHDRREVGLKLSARGRRQYKAVQQRQRQVLRNAAKNANAAVDAWISTLWNVAQALTRADRNFRHFCLQCGAYADGSCVLVGGDAKCLFLLEDASAVQSRRSPADRRPYRGAIRAKPRTAAARNARRTRRT